MVHGFISHEPSILYILPSSTYYSLESAYAHMFFKHILIPEGLNRSNANDAKKH